jgi:hypothetical protein
MGRRISLGSLVIERFAWDLDVHLATTSLDGRVLLVDPLAWLRLLRQQQRIIHVNIVDISHDVLLWHRGQSLKMGIQSILKS